jgi:uncharacterized protein with HEPN domain
MNQVWEIVQTDLPELNQQIARLLELLKDDDDGKIES